MAIDLHLHTKFSDGTSSLSEILNNAENLNLTSIAITDHEIVTDVSKLKKKTKIDIIQGCEVSVNWKTIKDSKESGIHLLFYFVQEHSPLSNKLKEIRKNKIKRNEKIINNLNNLGFKINKSVLIPSKNEVIGRPHIAKAMLEGGYVKSTQEAFDKFLGNGKPAYVDDHHLEIETLLKLSNESKSVCVLAHPHTLKIDSRRNEFNKKNWIDEKLFDYISELKKLGVDGIEAYYPLYNSNSINQLIDISKKLNMIYTGGSDYHGKNKPNLFMGFGYENNKINIPDLISENLHSYHEKL